MRLAKGFLVAGLFTCITFFGAAAQDDPARVLDELVAGAADVSGGIVVGNATITAPGGSLLQGEEACRFSAILNADEYCDTAAIVFPPNGAGIDSIYYYAPEDIGYVNMDDWTEDVNAQIDEIWQSYVEGSKAQSDRIGYDVVPIKWVLYPTLNKAAKVMTYGILLDFGGTRIINLTSVKFTRNGYVSMDVVTDDELLASDWADYDSVSVYTSGTYKPVNGLRYADFKAGDKVAAIGAVGVLATLVGSKQGQGWLTGMGAAILVFLKKFWILLLAVPAAIWGGIKKLVGR